MGTQLPLPKRGHSPLPIFGRCLLRPNNWMDQDGTWRGGRPRPRPHCARWGPSSHLQKGGTAPSQCSAHVYCDQTAGWIKIPHGREVGLGPDHIVLDGNPSPSKKGPIPSLFGPCMFIVAKRLYGSRCQLVRLSPGHIVLHWDPAPPKGHSPQFSAHVFCGQTVAHLSYC